MLARSTACRHGLGCTSANATSMSTIRPSRTSRLDGLTSRWARPASHSPRTTCSPSSTSLASTVTSSSQISRAPSANSVTSMYSRSGVSSTKPYVFTTGSPASRSTRSR